MQTFTGPIPHVNRKHPHVKYDLELAKESFYLFIPDSYDGSQPYGLLTFVNAGDSMELPGGWGPVLEEKQLLFLAPQQAGNEQEVTRRTGLPIVGMLKMMETYKIDKRRVYVSGLSGGARMASRLAYYHPDLVTGVAPICGVDFYEAVPRVEATNQDEYGVFPLAKPQISKTKQNVRFALITGETDFRRLCIRDLYNGGYAKQGFKAKLFDIPGMGHAICSAEVIKQALEFLDSDSRNK